MKKSTAERQDQILQKLGEDGFVSVPDMAIELRVSEMTIRRDLDRMAIAGHLERTHGGAAPLRANSVYGFDLVEPSLEKRFHAQAVQKSAIARSAAKLVKAGQTIALDIGTTTGRLAAELADQPVSIYTTSLKIAARLANERATVYLPGGLATGMEPSIVGARAVEYLKGYNFEIAFLGASSLSESGIFFDYSLEDTEIKRALIEVSTQVVMLLDSSKFNHASVARICIAEQIDTLITDREPEGLLGERLRAAGIEIIIAK